MKSLGIIGVGNMGAAHARILNTEVPGCDVRYLCDDDEARASAVSLEVGAKFVKDPFELIGDPSIDAVIIATPDDTHFDLVQECIRLRKPVLCEKPLSPDVNNCEKILESEQVAGSCLVNVGFMRRFDPGYAGMKARIWEGDLGAPVLLRSVQRCVAAPDFFNPAVSIMSGAVHDIDLAHWLLGSMIDEVSSFVSSVTKQTPGCPVLLVLKTDRGHLVDIETFIDADHGYEVRSEVVCEQGSFALRHSAPLEVNAKLNKASAHASDYIERFWDAYRKQFIEWVRQLNSGVKSSTLATAWDGYAATLVADAAIKSLGKRRGLDVHVMSKPSIYEHLSVS